MTIRGKLMLLVFAFIAALAFSLGFYIISQGTINQIQDEMKSLQKLETAYLMELSETNKADSQTFDLHYKDLLLPMQAESVETFKLINTIILLPKLNQKVKKAITSMKNLEELTVTRRNEMTTQSEKLMDFLTDMAGFRLNFTLQNLTTNVLVMRKSNVQHVSLMKNNVETAITSLSMTLESNIQVIEEQFIVIDNQVKKKIKSTYIITFSIIAVFLIIVIILALLMANSIAGNVVTIEKSINLLKGGDLTARSEVKSKDDLGRLSENLNLFTENLLNSVNGIKKLSLKNELSRQDLERAIQESTSSVTQIEANTQSIKTIIDQLNSGVQGFDTAFQEISHNVSSLSGEILNQSEMVEQSTAAVTEMIASIDNVAIITAKRKEATEQLVNTGIEGGERLNKTTNFIKEVNESIGSISSMTGLIQKISSQTNLLAMNAAIEAAHAGSAGRGFAVVADEIRNLAEASAKNAKEISQVIKSVIEKITGAFDAGQSVTETFNEINTEISDVTTSFDEINSSMQELKEGGQQILDAMITLKDVSVNVAEGSDSISGSTEKSIPIINQVTQLSSQVLNGVEEITMGMNEISRAVNSVSHSSGIIEQVSNELINDISQFKTESVESGNEDKSEEELITESD